VNTNRRSASATISMTNPNLNLHWKPACLWQRIGVSSVEKKTLLETLSLTQKFKQKCPDLTVEVLSEISESPLAYEREQLGLKINEQAWVRCILLKCGQQNKLYARTVIPKLNSGNPWYALKKLGTKPLGEVLFNLKNIQRSSFKISKQNYTWPHLSKHKPDSKMAMARYSQFLQQNQPLLLTEVFLEEDIIKN